MGNASSAGEEETVLAAQLASSSKDSYSTSQLRQYYLLMLEERDRKQQETTAPHHRTSSTCSSESLDDSSPRKRRLPYAGLTTRMVSRLKNRSTKVTNVDAFICYSRTDGMTVAKTLSEKLKDCDYRVKLDTKSKPASCTEAINNAKYAIVILSPAFFQDEHAMGVLERLICRQLNRGERFILPLWHEVDERQVFESWPQMCDIFGLKTSIGVPAIVREFRNKIIHGTQMCNRVCQV